MLRKSLHKRHFIILFQPNVSANTIIFEVKQWSVGKTYSGWASLIRPIFGDFLQLFSNIREHWLDNYRIDFFHFLDDSSLQLIDCFCLPALIIDHIFQDWPQCFNRTSLRAILGIKILLNEFNAIFFQIVSHRLAIVIWCQIWPERHFLFIMVRCDERQ